MSSVGEAHGPCTADLDTLCVQANTHVSFSDLSAPPPVPRGEKGVCLAPLALVGLSSSVQPLQLRLLSRSLISSKAARYFCSATLALSRTASSLASRQHGERSGDAKQARAAPAGVQLLPPPTVLPMVLTMEVRPPLLDASSPPATVEDPAQAR